MASVGPEVDAVVRLLDEQAPHLAHLPLRPSATSGSSNWVFRLGEELALRLPRTQDHADDLRKEVRWLPVLGPALTAPVPEVVLAGEPSETFDRPWAVVTWVPGETPVGLDGDQQVALAEGLGELVRSLHAIDAGGQPAGAEHWGYRAGEPVTPRIDAWAEEVADDLADLFDPAAVREAWRRLRDVPPATAPPVWVHTDLSGENVLVGPDGRLAGVIDFGGLGVGDGSVDLLYAWSLFEEPARTVFRTAAGADDATWARARAWAFVGPGLLTIDGYRDTMPERTRQLTAMVTAVAAEVGVSL